MQRHRVSTLRCGDFTGDRHVSSFNLGMIDILIYQCVNQAGTGWRAMLDQATIGEDAAGSLSPRKGRRPGLPGLPQQSRASASSIVETDLRDAIIAMALTPGMPLNEKELTARHGFSRTPVREALIRLKEEGLVEIFPQAGTFVSRIPAAAIAEAVIIREALESAAAVRVARGDDKSSLDRLDSLISDQHEAAARGDQEAFHNADEAFHAAISEAAGFPGIWRLAQTAKTQIDRARRLTLPVPGRMEMVIAEHLRIVDAMRRGDEIGVRQAIALHVGTILPDLERLVRDYPDYFI
jgi:GntR family transcriptional regulator, rspAB operon transcriptional repressor